MSRVRYPSDAPTATRIRCARWWRRHGEKRNRKRRERYRQDPAYRSREQARAREGMRRVYDRRHGAGWFHIGLLADLLGVTPDWLARMEGEGVIPEPRKASNGRRLYTPGQVRHLQKAIEKYTIRGEESIETDRAGMRAYLHSVWRKEGAHDGRRSEGAGGHGTGGDPDRDQDGLRPV